jgi:hypothetical protein
MTAGVSLPPYDNFTMTLSVGDTTETYQFFVHGTGTPGTGTHVATWVLVYTDSGRTALVSGTYTDLST